MRGMEAMKLLKIVSEKENEIDQALVIVPDDYDRIKLLDDIADVIPEPTIEEEVEIITNSEYQFDQYRTYIG